MNKGENMPERVRELIHDSNVDLSVGVAKVGVGVGASFAAMTINDIAALIVAILTGIYMIFQIESAWIKRKEARMRYKEVKDRNKK